MKTIAFDFDETITLDEMTFINAMNLFQQCGWRVLVVTFRHPNCDPHELAWFKNNGFEVFFTSQTAKREFMKEQGIEIDVWVDDTPESVIMNFHYSKGFFK